VHCAIDDHTRLAYAEIHPDETAATCADFLRAAAAWFAGQGVGHIERVMTDNAKAYRVSHAWRQALADIGAQARFTRVYRPQTNGKAERFNRTLAEEWAYVRPLRQLSRAGRGLARLAAPLQPSTAPTPHSVDTHRSAGSPSTTVLVNTPRSLLKKAPCRAGRWRDDWARAGDFPP
jgi:transposase InsO family protein